MTASMVFHQQTPRMPNVFLACRTLQSGLGLWTPKSHFLKREILTLLATVRRSLGLGWLRRWILLGLDRQEGRDRGRHSCHQEDSVVGWLWNGEFSRDSRNRRQMLRMRRGGTMAFQSRTCKRNRNRRQDN